MYIKWLYVTSLFEWFPQNIQDDGMGSQAVLINCSFHLMEISLAPSVFAYQKLLKTNIF